MFRKWCKLNGESRMPWQLNSVKSPAKSSDEPETPIQKVTSQTTLLEAGEVWWKQICVGLTWQSPTRRYETAGRFGMRRHFSSLWRKVQSTDGLQPQVESLQRRDIFHSKISSLQRAPQVYIQDSRTLPCSCGRKCFGTQASQECTLSYEFLRQRAEPSKDVTAVKLVFVFLESQNDNFNLKMCKQWTCVSCSMLNLENYPSCVAPLQN